MPKNVNGKKSIPFIFMNDNEIQGQLMQEFIYKGLWIPARESCLDEIGKREHEIWQLRELMNLISEEIKREV